MKVMLKEIKQKKDIDNDVSDVIRLIQLFNYSASPSGPESDKYSMLNLFIIFCLAFLHASEVLQVNSFC